MDEGGIQKKSTGVFQIKKELLRFTSKNPVEITNKDLSKKNPFDSIILER